MSNDTETENRQYTTEVLAADENGSNSDLGESIDTDITSLSSSVLNHVYENGRRYHSLNAGKYIMPNDETEQERLDMVHHTTSLMLDGELHLCSLPENLNRALDIGTGTGIWAIDFADQHPECQVIGVDLSPIQPSWVPSNCSFEVDDIEKPWLWKASFDFIHSASIGQGIRDWPKYAKNMFDHLSPGGVVQLMEPTTQFQSDDGTLIKGGKLDVYQQAYNKALGIAGLQTDPTVGLEGYLKEAGFTEVRTIVKKLPIGPWPKDRKKKELGKWGLAIIGEGLKAYAFALFTRCLEMTAEEANDLCNGALEDFKKRSIHTYMAYHLVEGRKPQ